MVAMALVAVLAAAAGASAVLSEDDVSAGIATGDVVVSGTQIVLADADTTVDGTAVGSDSTAQVYMTEEQTKDREGNETTSYVVTVTKSGEYVLSGTLDGRLVVDLPDGDEGAVTLYVDGVKISNSTEGTSAVLSDADLTVSGNGSALVTSMGNAVESEGTLTVAAGTLVASAGPRSSALVGETVAVTGGLVAAFGSENPELGETTTQVTLEMTFRGLQDAGILAITDSDAAAVIAVQASQPYEAALISGPALALDTTYSLYAGGSAESVDDYGVCTGYTAGTVLDVSGNAMPGNGPGMHGMRDGGRGPMCPPQHDEDDDSDSATTSGIVTIAEDDAGSADDSSDEDTAPEAPSKPVAVTEFTLTATVTVLSGVVAAPSEEPSETPDAPSDNGG